MRRIIILTIGYFWTQLYGFNTVEATRGAPTGKSLNATQSSSNSAFESSNNSTNKSSIQGASLSTESYSVRRGKPVKLKYEKYVAVLLGYYEKLKSELQIRDRAEFEELDKEPPKPVVSGYQLIPVVKIEDLNAKLFKEKFKTSTFSWKKTEASIVREVKKIERLKKNLLNVTSLKGRAKEYRELNQLQKIYGSQIQYLDFWQDQILRNKNFYDQTTAIYDQLVKGQMTPMTAVQSRLNKTMGVPPSFIKLVKLPDGSKEIHVDLVTDITDEKFVDSFQKSIEKYWHTDGSAPYSIKLTIEKIDPHELYGKATPPNVGAKIDIGNHLSHFGITKGILTTGDLTTYYSQAQGRHYVVIGSTDTSDTILAHEFGHIITLNDAYFRGYRDRGVDGLEVLEVIPDMTDIMCAPGVGRVKKHHFEVVAKALEKRDVVVPGPVKPILDRRPAGIAD